MDKLWRALGNYRVAFVFSGMQVLLMIYYGAVGNVIGLTLSLFLAVTLMSAGIYHQNALKGSRQRLLDEMDQGPEIAPVIVDADRPEHENRGDTP